MKRNIINSSSKIIGYIEITDKEISIYNKTKPILTITDKSLIDNIFLGEREEDIITLYDQYTLTVPEVAAIYDISYTRANKWFKQLDLKSGKKSGRRNSSYGKTFSKERINHMVEGRTDDHRQLLGRYLSEETKQKISNTVKQQWIDGHYENNGKKLRERWKEGVYEKVDFGHGIGGHIDSLKNHKRLFFRSLLELHYILMLENDPEIREYKYESLHIVCDNGTIYTPDFIVNNNVIELKSKSYIEKMPSKVKENFLYKKEQANKYCQQHNLHYIVIYDEDIGFESGKEKKFLRDNPDIIKKFNITFINPNRVLVKK